MAITGLRRVSGSPRITPINNSSLDITERYNRAVFLVKSAATTPTRGTRNPAHAGSASALIAGHKVAGSVNVHGGQL